MHLRQNRRKQDLPEVAAAVIVLVVAGTWARRLIRLGHSVVTYGRYWSGAQGVPGGLTYVALGDSAAQGIGASSPDRGYVGLLARRMRAVSGREVLIINLSASGATVRDVVDNQLPKLAGLKSDVVTVAVGGNDMGWYRADRFAQAAGELVNALPAGTVVADVPYFMHGRWERHAQQAGAALTTAARARGLELARLHDAERARGSRAMLTDFAADWFHPNDRGHRVWADAFWEVLRHVPALTAEAAPATVDKPAP